MCSDVIDSDAPADMTVSEITASDIAIDVQNLGKVYQIYERPADRLKQMLWGKKRQYYREFRALDNVSFQLPQGEVLGLVGRNGAGKSTLLQLICGTLAPTSGELRVNGRIAALLELGAGFNPQFTGRENVYLSAMVMGVERSEVDEKLEDIIDFSGVRPFIDQPVSTYSSGMYVRLAFAIATSVEPDILIIDEALSVGDGDFARRSFARIMAMRDAGVTILFCSHSLYQVEVLCSQAIWLEGGAIQASGAPEEVVPTYQAFLDRLDSAPQAESPKESPEESETEPEAGLQSVQEPQLKGESQLEREPLEESQSDLESESQQEPEAEREPPAVNTSVGARLTRIRALNPGHTDSSNVLNLRCGDPLQVAIEFQVSADVLAEGIPQVALAIHNTGGQLVTSCGSWSKGITPGVDVSVNPQVDTEGRGTITVGFEHMPLLKGTYYINVMLFCPQGLFLHDEADPAITLHMAQTGQERGLVFLNHQWRPGFTDSLEEPPRWDAVSASEVPESALLDLFAEVFGHSMSPELWRWKYRYAITPGSVALESGRPVAFNGAMPRGGLVFGEPQALVQVGDVMVAEHVRGILTRKGPFFMAMRHYLVDNVGEGKRYPYAFGFPNERAVKVGVSRGVYCEVDRIVELGWDLSKVAAIKEASTKVASDSEFESATLVTSANYVQHQSMIEQCWQQMAAELIRVAVGCRDSQWLRYRYLDKPGADYQVYAVADCGVVVLRDTGDARTELLDIVAPQAAVPALLEVACQYASVAGARELFAWATPQAASWFESTNPEVKATPVIIPGAALEPEFALQLKDAWWLMGGDADFR